MIGGLAKVKRCFTQRYRILRFTPGNVHGTPEHASAHGHRLEKIFDPNSCGGPQGADSQRASLPVGPKTALNVMLRGRI
jgi:hypothetical protein